MGLHLWLFIGRRLPSRFSSSIIIRRGKNRLGIPLKISPPPSAVKKTNLSVPLCATFVCFVGVVKKNRPLSVLAKRIFSIVCPLKVKKRMKINEPSILLVLLRNLRGLLREKNHRPILFWANSLCPQLKYHMRPKPETVLDIQVQTKSTAATIQIQ